MILSWRDLRHPHAGGSEVYTQNLARHWAAGGHQVTFFCSEAPGAAADETHDGYEIVRRGGRLSVYQEARRWYREHGRGRFDVVLDVVNTRPFLAIRWVDDVPVVALAHQVCREIWRYEMPLPLALVGRYWLEPRWLTAYRDVLTLTISESSRESLERHGLGRLEVVPVGVDEGLLTGGAVDKEPVPTLVWVGRLSANKRPGHAVEAFRLLRRRVPDARLWMVGDGPLRASLERGTPDGVRFFGRVDQDTKHDLMARAHLLVATSVREGWGLIVSEAALVGTPAVAYDVPGLRDSVAAAGGWLCAPDPTALAERLPAALAQLRRPTGGDAGTLPWPEVADEVLAKLLSGIEGSPIMP